MLLLRCWKTTGKHANGPQGSTTGSRLCAKPLFSTLWFFFQFMLWWTAFSRTRSSSFTMWMFTACKTQTAFTGSPKLCLMQTAASSRSGLASSCALEGCLKSKTSSLLWTPSNEDIVIWCCNESGRTVQMSAYKRTAGWILCKCKKFGGVFCDWESTLMGLSVLYMFILQKSKKKNELVQSDLACWCRLHWLYTTCRHKSKFLSCLVSIPSFDLDFILMCVITHQWSYRYSSTSVEKSM